MHNPISVHSTHESQKKISNPRKICLVWCPYTDGHHHFYAAKAIEEFHSSHDIIICSPHPDLLISEIDVKYKISLASLRLLPGINLSGDKRSNIFLGLLETYSIVKLIINKKPSTIFVGYPDRILPFLPFLACYLTMARVQGIMTWMRINPHGSEPLAKKVIGIIKIYVLWISHKICRDLTNISSDICLIQWLDSAIPFRLVKSCIKYHPELSLLKPISHQFKKRQEEYPTLLLYGYIDERKEVKKLIDVYTHLQKTCSLIIAGQAPDYLHSFLESASEIYGFKYLPGYLSKSDLLSIIGLSDIIWIYQPSHTLPSATITSAINANKVIITSSCGNIGYWSSLYHKSLLLDSYSDCYPRLSIDLKRKLLIQDSPNISFPTKFNLGHVSYHK